MSYWGEAAEAVARNVADALQNGPRLAWDRKTAAIAIDRPNGRVLKTGFGALGVGTMWVEYEGEDAEWADLPERDSTGGFGAGIKLLTDLGLVVSEALGPQGMLLVTTKCECSHGIANHMNGRCDVCPCQRSAADMAVKLNIEE